MIDSENGSELAMEQKRVEWMIRMRHRGTTDTNIQEEGKNKVQMRHKLSLELDHT